MTSSVFCMSICDNYEFHKKFVSSTKTYHHPQTFEWQCTTYKFQFIQPTWYMFWWRDACLTVLKVMNVEGYGHKNTTEQEHVDKVCRSTTEGAFLQHSAVPISAQLRTETHMTYSCTGAKRLLCKANTLWNSECVFVCTSWTFHRQPTERNIHIAQRGYRKIMLNKKLNPRGPKNKKFVISRHTYIKQETWISKKRLHTVVKVVVMNAGMFQWYLGTNLVFL